MSTTRSARLVLLHVSMSYRKKRRGTYPRNTHLPTLTLPTFTSTYTLTYPLRLSGAHPHHTYHLSPYMTIPMSLLLHKPCRSVDDFLSFCYPLSLFSLFSFSPPSLPHTHSHSLGSCAPSLCSLPGTKVSTPTFSAELSRQEPTPPRPERRGEPCLGSFVLSLFPILKRPVRPAH